MNSKKIYYEVDPNLFAKEKNHDIYNLKGLLQKNSYFKWLNIDAILLTNTITLNLLENKIIINEKLGNWNDFSKIYQSLKLNKIDLGIKINLELFYIFFINDQKNKLKLSNYETILFDLKFEKNQNEFLHFIINQINKLFEKNILIFWLCDEKDFIKKQIKDDFFFTKLFNKIREIDAKIVLINSINFTNDKFSLSNYHKATISLSKIALKQDKNLILYKDYKNVFSKKIINEIFRQKNHILYFYALNSGRINTIFCKNYFLKKEIAKALLMFVFFNPFSTIIKSGDELGVYNLFFNNLYEWYFDSNQKTIANLQSHQINNNLILKTLNYHNNVFLKQKHFWNINDFNQEYKNQIFEPNYLDINVESQFKNKNSPLFFFKTWIDFARNIFNHQNIHNFNFIYKFNHILIYNFQYNKDSYQCYFNFSNKNKKIKTIKNFSLIASNFNNKKYYYKINSIFPYEVFLIKLKSKRK